MSKFAVKKKRGIVSGVQTISKTHVSGTSSGGGGIISGGYGYVSAPTLKIKSSVEVIQRVFVRDERGGEWHFDVSEDFAVREGHRVAVSFISTKRGGTSPAFVRNMETGEGWQWYLSEHLPRIWNSFDHGFMPYIWALATIPVTLVILYVLGVTDFSSGFSSWSLEQKQVAQNVLIGVLLCAVIADIVSRFFKRRSAARQMYNAAEIASASE